MELAPLGQKIEIDAVNFLEYVDAFIEEKSRVCTPKTLQVYTSLLAPFVEWWKTCPDQHGYKVSQEAFEAFAMWLENDYRNSFDEPATPYTLWKVTDKLRSFLGWLHERGHSAVNVRSLCPIYHEPEKEKFFPTIDQLSQIFNSFTGPYRIRNAALFAFLCDTGCRRFEVINACSENIVFFESGLKSMRLGDDHSGYIHFRVTKGNADGKKIGRFSVFGSSTGLLLKAYMRSSDSTETVFDLKETGVRKTILGASIVAGIPEMHVHATRSAFIENWTEANLDSPQLADLALDLQVGHAIDKSKSRNHYVDYRNRNKTVDWIRRFYASVVDQFEIDWSQFPVHVQPLE